MQSDHSSLTIYISPLKKDCRGSNCGCPQMSCLGKEDGPGLALPLQFFRQHALSKTYRAGERLDRLDAHAFIQVMIEIVEVEYGPIQDQRKLWYIGGVYDQV